MKNILKKLATVVIATMVLSNIHTTAEASAVHPFKTAVSESINGYSLEVLKSRHDSTVLVRWNGKVYHRYDFGGKIRILPERKMTYKRRTHRKERFLYIERIIGKVVDSRGNGRTSLGNYISYKTLKPYIHKGDIVITYCVYNPYTNWFDDIDDRFDVILG